MLHTLSYNVACQMKFSLFSKLSLRSRIMTLTAMMMTLGVSQASSAAYDDRSLSLPYTLPNLPWHEGSVGDDDGGDDDADSVEKDYLQKCVQWTWPGKAWPPLDYNLTVHRIYFILYTLVHSRTRTTNQWNISRPWVNVTSPCALIT